MRSDATRVTVRIYAGAGDTESQAWAEMLLRMCLGWAERQGLELTEASAAPGGEAGITSATVTFVGSNAAAVFATERGVHRLVRISPFDKHKRRHTSFASLDTEQGNSPDDFEAPIRSYVLHPYSMARDHRSGVEVEDVRSVLAGELGAFMNNIKSPRGME